MILCFVDGDLRVPALCMEALAREVASAMRQSLLREDLHHRSARDLAGEDFDEKLRRHAEFLRSRLASAEGIDSVVKTVIPVLRRSANVEQARADDETLLRKILSVVGLLSVIAPHSAARHPFPAPGGGAGPAGGTPAEARVSVRPPYPRPRPEDLDRRRRRK